MILMRFGVLHNFLAFATYCTTLTELFSWGRPTLTSTKEYVVANRSLETKSLNALAFHLSVLTEVEADFSSDGLEAADSDAPTVQGPTLPLPILG